MKFCSKCGKELFDEAVICPNCGCTTNPEPAEKPTNIQTSSGLKTAAKIFMIISTVVMGIYIIPLAWCLPMTISYCNKVKKGEPISMGFKICSLLFVNTIAGILMLCDND